MPRVLLFLPWLLGALSVAAQDQPPRDWFHLDFRDNGFYGVSSYKAYQQLLKNKKPQKTVIVAVLDSGVDFDHEDLKDVMWTNPGEIPGNGKDDDHNGYVDDIHGWNFIGGKDGRNVDHEQLELTRLYLHYSGKFKNADPAHLSRRDKKEYERYQAIRKEFEKARADAEANQKRFEDLLDALTELQKAFGKDDFSYKDLPPIHPKHPMASVVIDMLKNAPSVSALRGRLERAYDYYSKNVNYYYNPDYQVRAIVGDDYANSYERYYGNNDAKGPDPSHGTHVAGIIAAKRNNGIGMDGIADHVRIMSVRVVPDGDERDKDVANGIIYAVDNGARIINMSFGKPYAWDKDVVDKAVRYAEKHGVLIVHAAMNDSKNIDEQVVYPNDRYRRRGLFGPRYARNFMNVGALSWKKGEDAIATFSNYGKKNVDVFAPGVAIYSTTPNDTYASYNGTSMATPVTAGIAAVLMEYFPRLSAKQVKQIIMDSAVPLHHQVRKTDTHELAPMTELCRTGGVVNLYRAIQLAEKY